MRQERRPGTGTCLPGSPVASAVVAVASTLPPLALAASIRRQAPPRYNIKQTAFDRCHAATTPQGVSTAGDELRERILSRVVQRVNETRGDATYAKCVLISTVKERGIVCVWLRNCSLSRYCFFYLRPNPLNNVAMFSCNTMRPHSKYNIITIVIIDSEFKFWKCLVAQSNRQINKQATTFSIIKN